MERSRTNMHLQRNLTETMEIYSMRIFLSSMVVVWVFFLVSDNENYYSEGKIGLYRCHCANSNFWRSKTLPAENMAIWFTDVEMWQQENRDKHWGHEPTHGSAELLTGLSSSSTAEDTMASSKFTIAGLKLAPISPWLKKASLRLHSFC